MAPRCRGRELAENCDHDLDREVGVHADPAECHEEHQRAWQIHPAAPERRATKHHLIDGSLVAHHREGGEDRAADYVAKNDDCDGLPKPELEDDAERAERPVDGGNVRARLLWGSKK
jgi:hypothetical protein